MSSRGLPDELRWRQTGLRSGADLHPLIDSFPQILNSELIADPPADLPSYSSSEFLFESYGTSSGDSDAVLMEFSDNSRLRELGYTQLNSSILGAGQDVASVLRTRRLNSWEPKLRYWFLFRFTDGRKLIGPQHGLRGSFKISIGAETKPGVAEADQWLHKLEKLNLEGAGGFLGEPYVSVVALGNLLLAQSRGIVLPGYAEQILDING